MNIKQLQHMKYLISILVAACLIGFIVYQEFDFVSQHEQKIHEHAQVIAYDIWAYDYDSPGAYLSLAVDADSYAELNIYDKGADNPVIAIPGRDLDFPDSFLFQVGLIRSSRVSADIVYKDAEAQINTGILGRIEALPLNKRIYSYVYAALLCLSILISAFLFINTLEDNANLEEEVEDQTRKYIDSEARFQHLVSNIPGVTYICLADKTATIKFISREIEKVSGYPVTDFLDNRVRTFMSIIHPDDLITVRNRSADRGGGGYTQLYRLIRRDGSIRWLFDKGLLVRNELTNEDELQGVIVDITKEKEKDAELEKYRFTLENMVAQKTEELEETQKQLLQIDKMASLGTLTAGAAQDIVKKGRTFSKNTNPENEDS